MKRSEQITDFAIALAKAQSQIKHAEKKTLNPAYKKNYADICSVYDAARKAMSDNGFSVVQSPSRLENATWVMITTLIHSSGQWMEGEYPINPTKNDPQGFGTGVTYARRYHYCSMCGVAATEDDDDGNLASGKATEQQPQHQQQKPVVIDPNAKASEAQFAEFMNACKKYNVAGEKIAEWIESADKAAKQSDPNANVTTPEDFKSSTIVALTKKIIGDGEKEKKKGSK